MRYISVDISKLRRDISYHVSECSHFIQYLPPPRHLVSLRSMKQTPIGGGEYKSTADFLKDDRRRYIDAQKQKELKEKARLLELEETKKKQEREHLEFIENWKSFYNGKGFDTTMHFVWDYGQRFFLSPKNDPKWEYNYVWSDPGYQGDGTIRPYLGTGDKFFKPNWGRDKGIHVVRSYVGKDTKFVRQ